MAFSKYLNKRIMCFKRNSIANFSSELNSVSHISYPIAQIFMYIKQKSQTFAFCLCPFPW